MCQTVNISQRRRRSPVSVPCFCARVSIRSRGIGRFTWTEGLHEGARKELRRVQSKRIIRQSCSWNNVKSLPHHMSGVFFKDDAWWEEGTLSWHVARRCININVAFFFSFTLLFLCTVSSNPPGTEPEHEDIFVFDIVFSSSLKKNLTLLYVSLANVGFVKKKKKSQPVFFCCFFRLVPALVQLRRRIFASSGTFFILVLRHSSAVVICGFQVSLFFLQC